VPDLVGKPIYTYEIPNNSRFEVQGLQVNKSESKYVPDNNDQKAIKEGSGFTPS